MRITVKHTTHYSYDQNVPYSAQLIRLHPRDHQGQRVVSWRVVSENGRTLPSTYDGYGNILHMLTRDLLHDAAAITAEGEVETSSTAGIIRDAVETLPVIYYLRSSEFTEPDQAIAALAGEAAGGPDPVACLHRLMLLIGQLVSYEPGSTVSGTTAAESLARGSGVCQDHAHIFLAAARLLGYPARYVSGYLWESEHLIAGNAGHAWAEAYVEGLGWAGFDPANRICPDEQYVRLAIGLDFMEAAPVRGVRRGAGEEVMRVSVEIRRAASGQ